MGIDQKKVKEKKAKNGDGKKRNKTPWKSKQTMRVERALKTLSKLSGVLGAAKPPNVDPALAHNALSAISTLKAQVDMLANDWKPAKGHSPGTAKKIGIGSNVSVKSELTDDEKKFYSKHFPTTLFTNSEVIDDDGRNWIVKCGDGVTRVVKKKHVAKHVAPVVAAAA